MLSPERGYCRVELEGLLSTVNLYDNYQYLLFPLVCLTAAEIWLLLLHLKRSFFQYPGHSGSWQPLMSIFFLKLFLLWFVGRNASLVFLLPLSHLLDGRSRSYSCIPISQRRRTKPMRLLLAQDSGELIFWQHDGGAPGAWSVCHTASLLTQHPLPEQSHTWPWFSFRLLPW